MKLFPVALSLLAFATPAFAQSRASGVVTGRVLNPATSEYVRNAEVRVQGTALTTVTGDGGYYELRNVPAGSATIVATYPGADPVTATVSVAAGGTATHDFELALADSRRRADQPITLGAFVVETEREGQSKMIAEQKQADLNANDIEAAAKIIAGTARSMGITVEA